MAGTSPQLEATLDHEEVVVRKGARTGLPVIVAVHSTLLGPALGGLRVTTYDSPADAVVDALRLSRGMTFKAASVDNGTGGGKAVVPLLPGGPRRLDGQFRTSVLLDLADVVDSLGGRYVTAPDVGTGPAEMAVVRTRTSHVGGYTTMPDGGPATTFGTAGGVERAILATARHLWRSTDLTGRELVVIGFGGVGRALTRMLLERGAKVAASDIDGSLRAPAEELGASWVPLEQAYEADVDLVVPCALGGVLTPELVPRLRCRAIVGCANNQLSSDSVAELLRAKGVLWAPDFVSNAGGILYASGREIGRLTHEQAVDRLGRIEETTLQVLARSEREGVTTLAAAYDVARERLARATAH
ncbi:Glu/Leu/Phe/Val dehydrogenase dimerization domain-containing protein [Streptomyces sp. NPDC026672]|uniref:Glu/Leu/Phe/Val family dehydrogenase n=1 Tax=unclassified Streptomyces TaxID=2593676 RepID=UPI0034081BF4